MNAEILQAPRLSNGRLLLLGVSSFVLCVSFFMSVFAPFPLALAFILYGRAKGFMTSLLGFALSFAFAIYNFQDLTLVGFYACVFLFGFAISEIAKRGISPVKGIITFGLGFLLLAFAGFGSIVKSQNVTVEQFILKVVTQSADKIAEQKKIIEQEGGKDSIQALQLLDRPDLLTKEILESFPTYIFYGVFLMLWFNMFLVLKSRRLLFAGNDYPYSERSLLNFKVPFGFVIPLSLGLVLAVWGTEFGSIKNAEMIGYSIVKCLGIFYFFQGFGVLSDLLTFVGIMGFFRTLLVMALIYMANYLIAAAGLFDNWFDFRKYFVKPKIKE